jgi:hypothetical protein
LEWYDSSCQSWCLYQIESQEEQVESNSCEFLYRQVGPGRKKKEALLNLLMAIGAIRMKSPFVLPQIEEEMVLTDYHFVLNPLLDSVKQLLLPSSCLKCRLARNIAEEKFF